MMKNIGVIILAAGFASRMGKQKLLLPLGEKPILMHVISTAMSTGFADCITVIGEPKDKLAKLCTQLHSDWVYNSERHTGQASSIVLGLNKLQLDLDGFLFLLGDQPLITQSLLQAIVDSFASMGSNKSIIVPRHKGQLYSPVLFGSWWRPHLAALSGDCGGRSLIRENPRYVIPVEWPDGNPFYDADSWEDYQSLCRLWSDHSVD